MSKIPLINTAGWDIGGAHLKLALRTDNNVRVIQLPCPLWRGLDELVASLEFAFKEISSHQCMHRVTMTGELVDIFAHRQEGVRQILNVFVSTMPAGQKVKVFAGTKLITVEQAMAESNLVASANWLASGLFLSRICKNALFIDMGSTTTDLLLIKNWQLRNCGYSDAERLRFRELIYTGIVRSCVNTISHHMFYRGELVPMIAENFATSADVYRILQLLPAHADSGDTMDGQAKDKHASARRLARMIGEDYSQADEKLWEQAAAYIADRQKKMLAEQIMIKLERLGNESLIVAAGAGRFLIQQIALENNISYCEFTDELIHQKYKFSGPAADCAPAVALALW